MSQLCIIYARTASADGDQFGSRRQIATCREYAQQKGWNVLAVYQDVGKSGNTRQREGLQAALQSLKKHSGAKLLVYSFDRLARDAKLMLEVLKENGTNRSVAVVRPSHALMETMVQFAEHMERVTLFGRVRRGKRGAPLTRRDQERGIHTGRGIDLPKNRGGRVRGSGAESRGDE